MSETIYSQKDVADSLGVSQASVCNWIQRYSDWPEPSFRTTDGLRYWDAVGLGQWAYWRKMMIKERERSKI